MNAAEFEAVLGRFRSAITRIERLAKSVPDVIARPPIREFNQLWSELDDHRLELEEAVSKPVGLSHTCDKCGIAMTGCQPDVFLCPGCLEDRSAWVRKNANTSSAIEKRLDTLLKAYVVHMSTLHDIEIDPTTLVSTAEVW